jgi:hypothetical protein
VFDFPDIKKVNLCAGPYENPAYNTQNTSKIGICSQQSEVNRSNDSAYDCQNKRLHLVSSVKILIRFYAIGKCACDCSFQRVNINITITGKQYFNITISTAIYL